MKTILLLAILLQATMAYHHRHTKKNRHRHHKDERLGTVYKIPEAFQELETILGQRLENNLLGKDQMERLLHNRDLTKGEVRGIWSTLDTKRDGRVCQEQWAAFHRLFIVAFEECDADENYRLNQDELGKCLESEALHGLGLTADDAPRTMASLDREEEAELNLADYMFLRRVRVGWEKCANAHVLSKIMIPCAMKVAVPGWVMTSGEAHQLFDALQAVEVGREKYYEVYMHVSQYLEYAHIYYYFVTFDIPYQNGSILKKDIVRAIDYQLVPTTLNNYLVDQLFGPAQSMDIQHFGVALILYRVFRRHSQISKFTMAKEEFLKVYDDPHICKPIVELVDSFTLHSLDQYEHAAELAKPKDQYTEQDFLVTFLQTAQTTTSNQLKAHSHTYSHSLSHKNHQHSRAQHHGRAHARSREVEPNPANREAVYNVFEFKGKDLLSFTHFLRWWKVSWFFLNCDEDQNDYLDYLQLRNCVHKYTPPLPFDITEMADLQQAEDFIGDPSINSLTLLTFYDMFTYKDVFEYYRAPNFVSFVSQANLKKSFFLLGLQVTQTTLDAALQGEEPATHFPLYNYWTAYHTALKQNIIAQQVTKDDHIQAYMDEHRSLRKKRVDQKQDQAQKRAMRSVSIA